MVSRTALFFTATSCSGCIKMHPIIDKLVNEGYKIEEVNVNQKLEVARKYNVIGLPTVIVFQGDKEIARYVGVVSIDALRSSLKSPDPDYKIW